MKPKRTILCVDDNEQSLSIRKVMLETRGYRVIAGPYSDDASLTAALARLRARGYQGAAVTDEPLPQEPNGTHLP